jgi:hypothetical protein
MGRKRIVSRYHHSIVTGTNASCARLTVALFDFQGQWERGWGCLDDAEAARRARGGA